MNQYRVELIRLGLFGTTVAADTRRSEFDIKNEVLVSHHVPIDFVFIGDYITNLWELNAYFGQGGRYIVNRGIGGDISSIVLKRFDADVIQLQPKHVVIKIGVNNSGELKNRQKQYPRLSKQLPMKSNEILAR